MGNTKIMVSVIMLTYNHEEFVAEAIESVLNQKVNFNYELLIGDDCSEDHTVEIIEEYKRHYPNSIRFFPSQENQGTTKNAYRLFLEAKGKYLASCEGDDYWLDSEKLQRQVCFLETNLRYIGCSHPVLCVGRQGDTLGSQKIPWITSKKTYTIYDFKGVILPGHSSSLVRRNIFLNSKYDYSIFWKSSKYTGDRVGAVLWAAQGDFYRLDQVMSCYRCIRGKQEKNVTSIAFMSAQGKSQREADLTKVLENYAQNELQLDLNFDYYRKRLLVSSVFQCLVRKEYSEWSAIKSLLADMRNPILGILSIPIVFLEKVWQKILLRPF